MTKTDAKLRAYIDRMERVVVEMIGHADDLAEIAKEAKDDGFDPSLIRRVATIRARDKAASEAEKIALLQRYAAVGGVQLDLDFKTPPLSTRPADRVPGTVSVSLSAADATNAAQAIKDRLAAS